MGTSILMEKLSRLAVISLFTGLSVVMGSAKVKAFQATLYKDPGVWQNQLPNPLFKTEPFDDPTLEAGVSIQSIVGVIQDGVWLDEVDNDQATTRIRFEKPIVAWGGDFDLAGPRGLGTNVALSAASILEGEQFIAEIPNTVSGEFWGFIADQPFDTVNLAGGTALGLRESYALDNMVYAEAKETEPIPEPTTIFGLLGFGSLIAVWRRKRQA